MTKTILAAIAALVIATPALAFSTIGANTNSNSQGSAEGQGASSYTGNGDVVGGNGTSGADQTTGPHSRPDAMIGAGVFNGKGTPGGSKP